MKESKKIKKITSPKDRTKKKRVQKIHRNFDGGIRERKRAKKRKGKVKERNKWNLTIISYKQEDREKKTKMNQRMYDKIREKKKNKIEKK